ncbi:MAG TPA: Cof-type HAD-IIB family hydrolase [Prevotella sp.]|nr:Cof-type HAD-IIB family hydrolase [Prevotella sp.]
MDNRKISALFFDIDGTLVSFETHEVPQSTIDAIAKAKANGVGIYISTGRPLQIITNLKSIEPYIDGYITTNGALCFVGQETVCCNPIPKTDVDALIADADALDYAVLVVGKSGVRLYNPKPVFDEVFVRDLNVTNINTSLPVSDILGKEPVLQLTPFFSATHERELMPLLSGCVSGRWHPAFTDITSRAADKGKGLEAMADFLGISIDETMAFGDGGNDVAILRRAGIGVAMGNGGEPAKTVADYITTSVDDNGVWNALKHFGVI